MTRSARIPASVSFTRALREWSKSLGVALVAWLLLRTFVVQSFRITSGSMEQTLLVEDWLFVAKPLYGAEVPVVHARLPALREPRRGEILVFDSVEEPDLEVVKRLIGVPGDTLWMNRGTLYRNGAALDEPYVQHVAPNAPVGPEVRQQLRAWQSRHLVGRDATTYAPDPDNWGPLLVPADSLFMLGDNRDDSYDSRFWGFLPRENVRGTPLVVYFSYDAGTWRPLPFLSAIRWDRLFSRPR